MKLLDHFHPPLSVARHWESFHGQWASSMAHVLNRDLLPAEYFAEFQEVHVGSRVEIDVATFEDRAERESVGGPSQSGGGTATLPANVWAPPAPEFSLPAVFPDSLQVLVFNREAGPTLVAAIELVSPGNKDRDETRRAFAAKCSSYLQQGIGLMIVDVVTSRRAQLHNDLVRLLNAGDDSLLDPDSLYATAYHPVRTPDAERIDGWASTLAIGEDLPITPLPLDKGILLPLDLAATYAEACQRSRLP